MSIRFPLLPLAAVAIAVALAGCAPSSNPIAVSATPGPGTSELGPEDGYSSTHDWVKITDDVPAVVNLAPDLHDALLQANDAIVAEGGAEILIVDGWRSENYQNYLFDEAVTKYGSEEEASRWVKRGDESRHVLGEAVDIATADAMDWLSRFGGEYGLCQIYANESWHFELAADENGVCPPMLTDGSAG